MTAHTGGHLPFLALWINPLRFPQLLHSASMFLLHELQYHESPCWNPDTPVSLIPLACSPVTPQVKVTVVYGFLDPHPLLGTIPLFSVWSHIICIRFFPNRINTQIPYRWSLPFSLSEEQNFAMSTTTFYSFPEILRCSLSESIKVPSEILLISLFFRAIRAGLESSLGGFSSWSPQWDKDPPK